MKDLILTIDLGTSGPKVSLFTLRGEYVAHAFQPNTVDLIPGGGAEQDPGQWWDTICQTSRAVLSESGIDPGRIDAIVPTTQWSGTVAVDDKGMHIRKAIIWMDSRGKPYLEKHFATPPTISGYNIWKLFHYLRINGGIPGGAGKDPAAHMLFIRFEEPEIYEKTAFFLEPKDYIASRLSGNVTASGDSVFLHFNTDNRDINNIRYHPLLVRYGMIDRRKLPPLVKSTTIVGGLTEKSAQEMGLPAGIPIVSGTPDVHSAAIGSGAVEMHEGHVYVGTSSWLVAHVPFKKTDIFNSIASVPSGIPGRYLIMNEQESAGACLNYLRDNIIYHQDQLLQEKDKPDVFKIFDEIVEGIPAGSDRLIFCPWLYGERQPVEDHMLRGILFNQSLSTNRGHMIRAIYEGVAYNSRWLMEAVESFSGKKFSSLRFVGGGANSDVWSQIYADVLNVSIEQVKDPILANSRGAALLGSLALGHITIDDIAGAVKVRETYHPVSENRSLYDELYREFRELHRVNKKIFHRLNRFKHNEK